MPAMPESGGDQQRLLGVVVAVAEAELLLAGLGDRHRAGNQVTLAGVEGEPALQGVEVGVLDHQLEVEVVGDVADHVDVEALDAGRGGLVEVLERRVGDVGADRELAWLDELGGGRRRRVVGAVVGARTTGRQAEAGGRRRRHRKISERKCMAGTYEANGTSDRNFDVQVCF